MARITGVLLDFDNTLHDLDGKMRYRFGKISRLVGHNPSECMEAYRRMRREFEAGRIGVADNAWAASLLKHLGSLMGVEEFRRIWGASDDYWQNGGKLYDDVVPFLDGLQPMGVRAYLFTNGSGSRREADLKSIGIGKYFAGVFGAQDSGRRKTDADFVARIRKEVRPARSIVIGDSMRDDVGMKRFGFRAVWLNRNGSNPECNGYAPDFVARDLYEALGYVRSLNGVSP